MQKITICRGLVASGKSGWSKKYVEEHKDTIRVSRDDLRHMRGVYWLPEQEKLITEWEVACIDKALRKGFNVIVDATNLRPKYIRKFFQKYYPKYTIVLKDFFDVSVEECIRRDKEREQTMGQEVIKGMAQKYLSKSLDVSSKEFIDSLYSQPIEEEKVIQNKNLPKAIICDLDGTLALHNGRDPFEYHRCDEDLVNKPIISILAAYQPSHRIIFLSGREDICIDKTKLWLENVGFLTDMDESDVIGKIENCRLHMRKSGDMRKDCIIKKEMFNEFVKDKFYINFILDDRNQVVDMWRSMGLTCLQVAEGNF